VLGAGLVSRPLVQYLLNQNDYHVTVASRTVSKAEALIDGHERGTALPLNVENHAELEKLVSEHDLSISLLPYLFHVTVAKLCLKYKKHLVTTSYVSDDMKALDAEAKELGLTFLNEIGLDPGIDHMSAMKIIHAIQRKGGRITGFFSYCGGLPAPEANTNPWGYKFSWSPRGVVLAGRNNARYLKDGKEVEIPGPELFANHWLVSIQGYGELEAYPNRDSIPYIDIYELNHVEDMLRGTLRNLAWSFTMKKLAELNYFDLEEMDMEGMTYADLMRRLIDASKDANLPEAVAAFLEVHERSETLMRFEWLGLLSDDPILTGGADKLSPLDALANKMQEKLVLGDQDRDFCVMQHEFIAEYDSGRKTKTYSTLLQYGIPDGDSSMARTVSLPAAIGARMILEGKITDRGVLIPVQPSIYEPVLNELEVGAGIVFSEKTVPL
jgi:saccharopine dehydrogenase (NADP+, L-glutamate forming)/spermidine synthase